MDDDIDIYRGKTQKTPGYYMQSFFKIAMVLTALFFLEELFKGSKKYMPFTPRLILTIVMYIGIVWYMLRRKYINYIKINNTKKTLEINYIKPFEEVTKEAPFLNFSFYVDEVTSYRRPTYRVIRINLFNDTQLKISEQEFNFSKESLDMLISQLAEIKRTNRVIRKRR